MSRIRFLYPAAEGRGKFAEYLFCSRHAWPWRAGRGNGTVEMEWL